MLWPRSDRWSSPKNLGKKHLIWNTDDKSLHVCSFHYESKKHEREWTTECTTHGQGGTRLTIPQPHPHVQKAPLLVGESSAMRCDVTCLWALATGANMSVALGWAQAEALCLRHVGPSGITAWVAAHVWEIYFCFGFNPNIISAIKNR